MEIDELELEKAAVSTLIDWADNAIASVKNRKNKLVLLELLDRYERLTCVIGGS